MLKTAFMLYFGSVILFLSELIFGRKEKNVKEIKRGLSNFSITSSSHIFRFLSSERSAFQNVCCAKMYYIVISNQT